MRLFAHRLTRTLAGHRFHCEGIMNNPFEHHPSGAAARAVDPAHASTPVDHELQLRAWSHKVSAIYPSREEAVGVRLQLIEQGFAADAITVLQPRAEDLVAYIDDEEGSDEVLKEVLVDGAIGTAVGTGIGAIGTVALVAANVTLFVAAPVIGPLAMLGWFAGLGGVIGATVGTTDGASGKSGKFSDLVKDAVEAGNTVLVVRTRDPAETDRATALVSESLRGRDQIAMESN